jgi:predicted RNase H-like nuclease (RuvC/YqgF family)
MAKVDAFVVKDSLTADGDFLAKGTKASIDKKVDKKLFDLGNVEDFDEKKHAGQADPLLKLKIENEELLLKVAELEKENEALVLKVSDLEKEIEASTLKVSSLEHEIEIQQTKVVEMEKDIEALKKPKGK